MTAQPVLGTPGLDSNPSDLQKPERLHKAAQEFESLLISEMLKTAHASDEEGWLGGGESTGSDSMTQMAESQLATALSSGKGMGLASVIERSMAPRLHQNVAETPPAKTGVSLNKSS